MKVSFKQQEGLFIQLHPESLDSRSRKLLKQALLDLIKFPVRLWRMCVLFPSALHSLLWGTNKPIQCMVLERLQTPDIFLIQDTAPSNLKCLFQKLSTDVDLVLLALPWMPNQGRKFTATVKCHSHGTQKRQKSLICSRVWQKPEREKKAGVQGGDRERGNKDKMGWKRRNNPPKL